MNFGNLLGAAAGAMGGGGGQQGGVGNLLGLAAGALGGQQQQNQGGGAGNPLLDVGVNLVTSQLLGGSSEGDRASADPSSHQNYKSIGPVTGKRRALFIGINYTGSKAALNGCHTDVKRVHEWLTKTAPFQDIKILVDDGGDASTQPTKANILAGFDWLVQGVAPGDSLFLHYSGHGGYQEDPSSDEEDKNDETIIPVDYESAGVIVDDEIHAKIAAPLPEGARLTAIFDCCHSGSAMDLAYTYAADGNLDIVMIDNKKAAMKKGIEAGIDFIRGNKAGAIAAAKDAFGLYMKKPGNSDARQKLEKNNTTRGFVVQFSGCQDTQTSADATISGVACGAMSWALLETLGRRPQISYVDLLKDVRGNLHGKYSQIPQISTGFPIDLDTQFAV